VSRHSYAWRSEALLSRSARWCSSTRAPINSADAASFSWRYSCCSCSDAKAKVDSCAGSSCTTRVIRS
jgi:hypothetical protein